jgi:purine-cytosine permease-like protein
MLIAPPLALIAAKDWMVVLLAGALAAVAIAHQFADIYSPWWLFAGIAVAVIARLGWLAARRHDRIVAIDAWHRAMALAKAACPNKAASNAPRD